MPDRNRVTPLGDIEAFALRGAFTGNRGRVHEGREIKRFHAGDLWIICALRFHERWHPQWQPGHFTWLFFHDEAVAFAAGHRPCGECRHSSYVAYRDAWLEFHSRSGLPIARAINRQLHSERIVGGTHRRRLHSIPWRELPDGAFVFHEQEPHLVRGQQLVRWTRGGYRERRSRPLRGEATVITPPSTVSVLRAGYPLQIDDAAA
jgi:hypothetical protein